MNRLRNRLLLVFLAATLAPLAATLWITTTLLDRSLSMATTNEVDELSRSLQATGRGLYTATQDALKLEAAAHTTPRVYRPPSNRWPEDVRQFFDTEEPERFQLAGESQIESITWCGADLTFMSSPRPIAGPGHEEAGSGVRDRSRPGDRSSGAQSSPRVLLDPRARGRRNLGRVPVRADARHKPNHDARWNS